MRGALCRVINEHVPGTGVEGKGLMVWLVGRGQIGYVADTADIQCAACERGMRKEHYIEMRHKGCTLSASRHIARAKIGNGGDAGAFGDHRWLAQLECGRIVAGGNMPQGLTMTADEINLRRFQPGGINRAQCRLCKCISNMKVERAQTIHGAVLGTKAFDDFIAQIAGMIHVQMFE